MKYDLWKPQTHTNHGVQLTRQIIEQVYRLCWHHSDDVMSLLTSTTDHWSIESILTAGTSI